jgi:hypothetical protein
MADLDYCGCAYSRTGFELRRTTQSATAAPDRRSADQLELQGFVVAQASLTNASKESSEFVTRKPDRPSTGRS